MRQSLLQFVTIVACVLVGITELLSLSGHFERIPLLGCWALSAVAGAVTLYIRSGERPRHRITLQDPFMIGCAAACVVIVGLTGFTAVLSPPNSSDAMAYHLPRVIYWAQQRSVRFFPTPYLNQIMLQPFAEYVMLHLYVITGTDRLANLVQWSASIISLMAVTLAAAKLGASPRGQAMTALFSISLPSGILASSGAKNDYVAAMWIAIAVCFALGFAETRQTADALFLGAAFGLALLTKATAYLFLPWLICAVVIAKRLPNPAAWRQAGAALACALALNAPHFTRNYILSGSVLGFDSAQGDGLFRWRNESFGWKTTASNALRHVSEQIGVRSARWNRTVYETVLALHSSLNIDPNDTATTFRWTNYAPPKNANHEADAPNPWHLTLIILAAGVVCWRSIRGGDRVPTIYVAALLLGFVAFCGYLKWQPFSARLFLPLYIAAAPLVGVALGRNILLQISLCLFLISNSRLAALQNWVRPLQGAHSILTTPRDSLYFADMAAWNNQESYEKTAEAITSTGCNTIGIDINILQLEYPLIHLIREKQPSAYFVHTAVDNPSGKFDPPAPRAPCVVACLDCLGDRTRMARYTDFPKSVTFGKFAVFSRD